MGWTLNDSGNQILSSLQTVKFERDRRATDPAFAAAVGAVKQYQHQRFERTYADLLSMPRYSKRCVG